MSGARPVVPAQAAAAARGRHGRRRAWRAARIPAGAGTTKPGDAGTSSRRPAEHGCTACPRSAGHGVAPSLLSAGHLVAPPSRSAGHGVAPPSHCAEHGFRPSPHCAEHGFRPSPRCAEHGCTPSPRSAEHGFTPFSRSAEHGFTLVELVVALFVFGLLAAAGVALLGFGVRAQAAAGARLDEVAAIRRLSAILTADLAQAAPRVSRRPDGTVQPAFVGSPGGQGQIALAFVRRGWENPDGAPRASVQKVEYRLVGDRLERRTAAMVDGAAAGPPATILRGVRALALRYRDRGEWRGRWDAVRPAALPRAVEMVVDVAGIGTVRQLFQTGTGA